MIVTKIGGSIAPDASQALDEIAETSETVLVHGFGPQTTRQAEEQGIQTRWIRSPEGVRSRFTDEDALAAMQQAAREVGEEITQRLEDRGRAARRIPGFEDLLQAEAKPALRHEREDGRVLLLRGNRSGRVQAVDPQPIQAAFDEGLLPVVTPLARDDQGLVSVDADRAAAAIAGSLDAEELVLLTDVDRVLDARGDPIHQLPTDEIDPLRETGALEDGMLRKVLAAREAIDAGVEHVWIAHGYGADPIDRARRGHATEVRCP